MLTQVSNLFLFYCLVFFYQIIKIIHIDIEQTPEKICTMYYMYM